MRITLLSTYEMGRQPFGLASPAAWLRAAGHEVDAIDLSRDSFPADVIACAELAAVYVPMHTATVLALQLIPKLRRLNPRVRLAAYGLYAPMNGERLRSAGVEAILGGEFEHGLVDWAAGRPTIEVSLERQSFLKPDRTGLPKPTAYSHLMGLGPPRMAGYTEASRGCKHLCRHCPIVPVYRGAFRIVQREVVLSDIRQQVEAGARHITFGDPDFLNGPGHALPLVEALHREFPSVTYDVTIKIEHLLKHRAALPVLKLTGCVFVTSAVESVDDAVLERFAKNHTRADFYQAVNLMREVGLAMNPTFVSFTPWTAREGYRDLLRAVAELGLIENVAPVQYAIRLLIPVGSLLFDLPEMQEIAGPFDPERLVHPWKHPDPAMDQL
ncbi:MAG: CUAEP/CCAEP-tail radical SAM protein, partial [Acidobacteriota bacterium]|nr:CUAEP/CCAEP-tail radical SAM protein [Acidobacteriota bacterium]